FLRRPVISRLRPISGQKGSTRAERSSSASNQCSVFSIGGHMAKKSIQLGLFAACAVVVLTVLGLATARAQSLGQTSGSQVDVLVSEVKLMRAALQEMAQGQSQLHAL